MTTNLKQELPVVAMFVNGSKKKERKKRAISIEDLP
jgi:hypothetical protein